MKSMIWHPEEKDQKVNQYLEQSNHAPYEVIMALLLIGVCILTTVTLFFIV